VTLLLPWSKTAQAQGPECVNGYYEMFWDFESGLGEWVNDPNGHFFQDAFGYQSSYSMSRDNNNDGGTINLLQSSMLAKLGLPANTTIPAQNIQFQAYYYSGGNTWYRFNLVNEQEEVIFKEEAVSSGHCSFGAWCLRTTNLSISGNLNRITINAWGLFASRFDNLKISIPCSNFSSTYAIYLPFINKGPDIYPFRVNPETFALTHPFVYPSPSYWAINSSAFSTNSRLPTYSGVR
jgi:hypothetical protein